MQAKATWDEKFGTTTFTPPHMDQVVVDAWNMFTLKSAPIIVNAFEKTHIHPLQPPKEKRDNTVVASCAASIQCGTGKKAK